MTRLLRIVVLACVTVGSMPTVIALLPPETAYRLSNTCGWSPRPWARLLGADAAPLRADPLAMWQCRHQRGLKSRTQTLNHVSPRWPSKAQLAAWEHADGHETTISRQLPAISRVAH